MNDNNETWPTIWLHIRPGVDLGRLIDIFDANDPRPAVEQVNDRYAHGGGWRPFEGFAFDPERKPPALEYEGDPPRNLLSMTVLPRTNEYVAVFESDWVMIEHADGSREISRMD